MQRAFLVINKETQIASYLQHRSILDVIEERRSLTTIDLNNMPIVDTNKLVIIFYSTDDEGLSFRSEMNALRNLLASAFFNTDTLTVILVNFEDPLAEDLVSSAVRDTNLTKDKMEIIHHSGTLMFSDVSRYIAGAAAGQNTSSTFKSVYVREADKEEKDRYENQAGEDGLDTILPALTDMAALYKQRAHVEAISAGRVVTESAPRPETVNDFTRVHIASTKTYPLFVVAGEQWTNSENAIKFLVEYSRVVGRRVLVINTDVDIDISKVIGECVEVTVAGIKVSSTPNAPVAYMNVRFNQLGYVVQFLHNVLGIEEIYINTSAEDYLQMCKFARQMSDETSMVYVAHFNEKSVQRFIQQAIPATSLFLTFKLFHENFDLEAYRESLARVVVGKFPVDDVDVIEFRDLATGSKGDDDNA